MDWSWLNIVLLVVALVLIGAGLWAWTSERYAPSLPLGGLAVALGAVLLVVALLLIFGEWLRFLLDNDWMDWGWFTGWARSSFVRWTLVILLLVIVGISAYLWRAKNHEKRLAASSGTGVMVTTH